jgi:hypothetical protein
VITSAPGLAWGAVDEVVQNHQVRRGRQGVLEKTEAKSGPAVRGVIVAETYILVGQGLRTRSVLRTVPWGERKPSL